MNDDHHQGTPPWDAAHQVADQAGHDGYMDPATGFFVFTAGYLRRRGGCCSNDCRHCPYDSGGT